jgi:hypothetical protein
VLNVIFFMLYAPERRFARIRTTRLEIQMKLNSNIALASCLGLSQGFTDRRQRQSV